MYNNSQAGAPPMNTGTMQNMDHNGTQGQPGHIPQAPIGSPMPSNMPPMPSGGQYMTGYPTNVSQMNMNSNYHLSGDPNKMLSGGRHKKEVKRRTKTGCLTCRKRRIKVCFSPTICIVDLLYAGAGMRDAGCSRLLLLPAHRKPRRDYSSFCFFSLASNSSITPTFSFSFSFFDFILCGGRSL